MTHTPKTKKKLFPGVHQSIDEPLQRPVTPGYHRTVYPLPENDTNSYHDRDEKLQSLPSDHPSTCGSTSSISDLCISPSSVEMKSSREFSSGHRVDRSISAGDNTLSSQSTDFTQDEVNGQSHSKFPSAFTSKPKIPRTPEVQSASPRKGKVPAIAPQFSQSGPQQTSRPSSSGSSRRSRQSSQSYRKWEQFLSSRITCHIVEGQSQLPVMSFTGDLLRREWGYWHCMAYALHSDSGIIWWDASVVISKAG